MVEQGVELVVDALGFGVVACEKRVPDFAVDVRHGGSRHDAVCAPAEALDHLETGISDEDFAVGGQQFRERRNVGSRRFALNLEIRKILMFCGESGKNFGSDRNPGLFRRVLKHNRNFHARTDCVDVREQRRSAGLEEEGRENHHAVRAGGFDAFRPLHRDFG